MRTFSTPSAHLRSVPSLNLENVAADLLIVCWHLVSAADCVFVSGGVAAPGEGNVWHAASTTHAPATPKERARRTHDEKRTRGSDMVEPPVVVELGQRMTAPASAMSMVRRCGSECRAARVSAKRGGRSDCAPAASA